MRSTVENVELIKKLYQSGLTQTQVAHKLNVSQAEISRIMRNNNIQTRENKWKEDEIEYLMQHYGSITVKEISKNLKRTEMSIVIKAKRLGINALNNTEKINAKQLAEALNVDRKVIAHLINDKGLKAKFKSVKNVNKKFWRISIDDFWKWAEKNKDLINFSKMEKNILGKEPKWVDEQRKIDFRRRARRENAKWQSREDEVLKTFWKHRKAKEIAIMLSRSEASVLRRASRLGLERKNIVLPWQKIEIETLIEMKLDGALDKEIAWELGRDEGQVSWKRKELIKNGLLDWKYRKVEL